MKYKINPCKLAKAPQRLLPILLACLEYDDSSPFFEAIRLYMIPATPEERWNAIFVDLESRFDELTAAVQMRHKELGSKIERKYQAQLAMSRKRFKLIKAELAKPV
jgi:hypothetical protein